MNDNAPQFLPTSNYVFSFSENQQSGAVVGSVNTSDRDDDGPNSLVSIMNRERGYLVVKLYDQTQRITPGNSVRR